LNISIIIPTLNEENSLSYLLSGLNRQSDLEIIVSDGGSHDQTVKIARENNLTVVTGRSGRGAQLNKGALKATGEILLFLHSDTVLPDNFIFHIQNALSDAQTVAGAFKLSINDPGKKFRIIEFGIEIRSRILRLIYGDQAIFVRKNIFLQAGGFPDQPIFEDVVLIRKLKRYGKIVITSAYVVTSPRRWKRLGVFKTTIINQIMLLGFILKINPEKLAIFYYSQSSNNTK